MRPRANTISHVDGNHMQMIAAANASVNRQPPSGHSHHNRHTSLVGLPLHNNNFDSLFSGMSNAMGHRGTPIGLPKIETAQNSLNSEFSHGLRTAPPLPLLANDFDFDNLMFTNTINPNALHFNDSPPSLSMDPSPFPPPMSDLPSAAPLDDSFDWLTGFEHSLHIQNENAMDESSPSALSTTSQSGISDVMVDGSNQKAPAGTGSMWQPSVMGPPQVPQNPFAMDLNGSVFPDLLSGAPMSPQPASQKINDPYFSTPPPSLSSLSPSAVPGLNAHPMKHALDSNIDPETPHSLGGGNSGASPVTTLTDATRIAIVNALTQCPPFGGRKYSFTSQSSPQSPGSQSTAAPTQATNLPSTQDLQRYVGAYIAFFHPHLPFLHIPTLSFDVHHSPQTSRINGIGGGCCLVLPMAAIGALYEGERAQSRELFDMAKKLIFNYLEERRKAGVRKADGRRDVTGSDYPSEVGSDDQSTHTPVWLVQAMLLNVVYGHNCGDKTASDIASTHCAALVSLAQAANLLRPSEHKTNDEAMLIENWGRINEEEEKSQWLQWKSSEERKRTLYVVFILSSLLVTAYNHSPALTNSELFLDLPCDEDFFSAETSAAFSAKGGVTAANHNQMTFHDALGELLRTNERQQARRQSVTQDEKHTNRNQDDDILPQTGLRPSTFGCLVLINALHNYIWETRQRHHNKVWTNEETEKMHRHIEPALKAWQAAWASNPQHSLQRPNPYGIGPLSADAIPLLDLAYVRLFVNLSRSKERFWQRDWDGMAEELAKGSEIIQHADMADSNNDVAVADADDMSVFADSPMSTGPNDLPKTGKAMTSRGPTRRERHLRKAAFYAADSLAMSDKLGVSFADFTSKELPLQSAMCAFDCAQVLAEWVSTLQDRVGRYLGILGHDNIDFTQLPAIVLLEDEDIKLLEKIKDVLGSAELKINVEMVGELDGAESKIAADGHNGFATKILRITAYTLDKAAVWPVTNLMARCLETHSNYSKLRAEKSVARNS